MNPKKEGDKQYTTYFGLNESLKSNDTASHVFRVFQTHRLNKTKLIRELRIFIDKLEGDEK